MTCTEWRIQISSDLDGALSERELHDLRSHLDGCGRCRGFQRQQQDLNSLLAREELQLEPPSKLWAEIEARIVPAPATVLRPARWSAPRVSTRTLLAAAACLLLMLISGSLFIGPEPVSEEELLAQIRSYEWQVPDNPFFEPLAGPEGNPFDVAGSPK